jgi:hypothetical protein
VPVVPRQSAANGGERSAGNDSVAIFEHSRTTEHVLPWRNRRGRNWCTTTRRFRCTTRR